MVASANASPSVHPARAGKKSANLPRRSSARVRSSKTYPLETRDAYRSKVSSGRAW